MSGTKRPHYETLLTNIVVISVSLFTASLNLLVIVSISHFKQLHTSTNLLLLSLAVSDFFMGLFMSFQIDSCWFFGNLICSLCQYLIYIISSACVGNMVLISVDRYVAVCYPLHYSTKLTENRMKMCVCLCWTCSALYQGVYLKDNLQKPGRFNSCLGECVLYISYVAGLVDVVLSFILPITVIIALYIRVFVVAVSQARAVRSHITSVSLTQRSVKVSAKKSELKAARNLGVVIAVFLTCLCPFYCVSLTDQDTLFSAFAIYLYYLNSCLNPVIYAFFYSWFRKSVKLIITLKILQPDSSQTNVL
ncbi:trace amine-associated receptor 13c-like [Betta splendens]|uniref:Trace amine-associated receptor 13c-like n=1 Tax=Betta splendens TaxID=158456 RepID=A0A6P7LBU3_BETSP|nr:trace amine-associated receptor 13c-like [Betta splendens]